MAKLTLNKIPPLFASGGKFTTAKRRAGQTKLGEMNRTEAAYAEHLCGRVIACEIVGWRYEAYKLRLADRTYFTPDFVVQMPDGTIELHEVKASSSSGKILIEDDAAVKIKVAAQQYPEFRFVLAVKRKDGWAMIDP